VIPIEDIAAILLCAGLSRRFGAGNKLLAPLGGRPLVSHAAALIGSLPFARRIAVLPAGEAELDALLGGQGFERVENPRPEAGRQVSLRLGIGEAMRTGVRGVAILLGDMPWPDARHLEALAAAADERRAAVSAASSWNSPPLVVPAALARRILADGATPAREVLAGAVEISASPAMLADFDTPLDFARGLRQEESWPA
jgi:molybdenum cofactor cytidylyltransferase